MGTPSNDRKAEAIESLRETFPVGSTVPTVLRHVSRSGMSRSISVLVAEGGEISDISWQVARAGIGRFDQRHGGIVVNGAGMDMGFDIAYRLSLTLHGDGYALSHRWV